MVRAGPRWQWTSYSKTATSGRGSPPYSWTFGTGIATGGTPPYRFNFRPATINSLPPGLDGTEAGVISGIPTTAGNYTVQATVFDAAGDSTTLAINLSVLP